MSHTGSQKQRHSLPQMEERYQESDQYFQAVWEYASDAMALSAPDGTIIAANPAYFQLYGYSSEEVIGKNYSIIFPPEQREWAQQLYVYVFESPTLSPAFETPIRRSDGTVRFVSSSYNFLTRNGVRYAMLSIVRDITAQKQVEEMLQENELKLHLALEVGHMVSWDWDIASNTLRWSANLESALGFPPGSSGMTCMTYQAFLELVDAQDCVLIKHKVRRTLEEGDDFQVEFRAARADGKVLWTRAYGQVIFDEENKPMRVIGICTDITHYKQSEEPEHQDHL